MSWWDKRMHLIVTSKFITHHFSLQMSISGNIRKIKSWRTKLTWSWWVALSPKKWKKKRSAFFLRLFINTDAKWRSKIIPISGLQCVTIENQQSHIYVVNGQSSRHPDRFWKCWHYLALLTHFLPLLRAFKWGTAWPCISRGIKNMTGQS